ncbi:MAG: hypothetical protein IPK33_04990 [Gemmatimonadetes bacterium]|nr:hypothetical protein [Gemmatimonadota bacterium]
MAPFVPGWDGSSSSRSSRSCPWATSTRATSSGRATAARDTLALVLYAPNGALVETSRIDITPDAASSTGLTLDVGVVDETFWRR